MGVTGFNPGSDHEVDDYFRLLRNLAEDLKVPFAHIIANTKDEISVEKTVVSAVGLI